MFPQMNGRRNARRRWKVMLETLFFTSADPKGWDMQWRGYRRAQQRSQRGSERNVGEAVTGLGGLS